MYDGQKSPTLYGRLQSKSVFVNEMISMSVGSLYIAVSCRGSRSIT